MSVDPRAALSLLVAAFERHLEVSTTRRDPDDPGVVAAALDLADAFDDYDEALFLATEVMTPLVVDADDDEDDDDEDDDEDDDDEDDDDEDESAVPGEAAPTGLYAGLDDEDVDFDDDDEDEDDEDDEDEEEDDAAGGDDEPPVTTRG